MIAKAAVSIAACVLFTATAARADLAAARADLAGGAWLELRTSFCVNTGPCKRSTIKIFADGRISAAGEGELWNETELRWLRKRLPAAALARLRGAIAQAKFSSLRGSYAATADGAAPDEGSADDKTATTAITIAGRTVTFDEDASAGPGSEFPTAAPARLVKLRDAIWRAVLKP